MPGDADNHRDFAVWQKQDEQVAEHQRQLEYWTRHLADSSPAVFLSDRPRPATPSGQADVVEFTIKGPVYEDFLAFCQAHQVTPFVVMLAVFRATHYRLTGAEDATIGTPIANRNRPELDNMIGFFVNTQCMRITVRVDDTFEGLVEQVRSTATAAFVNQDVPFDHIVSALLPGSRDTSRNPLVQLMFALHSQHDLGKLQLEGLVGESVPTAISTRFDAEFHLFQQVGGLDGRVLFAAELFNPETMKGVVDVFQEVLLQGLKQPCTPVATLPLTNGLETLRSMGLLEIERTEYPRESSIVDIFREQVTAYPDATAVTDSLSQLTYSQLDRQSEEVVAWLQRRNMAAETLIGVLAPRSCQTVVAFLGILKANLAYLPLDINVPAARIKAILSAVAGHKLVLLGTNVPVPETQLLDVELVRIGDTLSHHSLDDLPKVPGVQPSATSLAYVMFTSGSTGKPKGVMVEHRSILRLLTQSNVISRFPRAARVAFLTNIAFDVSVWEICAALLNGGVLVCIDYFTTLDSKAFEAVFAREQIQATMLPPALLKQCLANAPATIAALDALFIGSDRFDSRDAIMARGLVQKGVYNAYGPTENGVQSTIYSVAKHESFVNGVPIGRAVSNSGAYIMDPRQQLVPPGVMGELVVTGDGLARGYTDPALDLDRFVHVTIDGQIVRAYRTGDRARYRPTDGQIEFFGRMDQQIKIRGYRIEPVEVEHAMLSHNAVRDAVVVVQRQEGQEPEMVGFVAARDDKVGDDPINPLENWEGQLATEIAKEILSRLRTLLPPYMIPARIVVLDQLPVNANGKVDRQELAQRARVTPRGKPASARMAPRNEIEVVLCEELIDVLGAEVGITDNFFDLGGHSLMAIKFATRISRRLDTRVTIKDIFDQPVLADLGNKIQLNQLQQVAKPYNAR